MIGIYKITNKINGKVYIGQSINIEKRWKQHINDPGYNIHNAIKKYGKENFSFEVLLECPVDMLDVWESDMINLYDCVAPKGYNIVPNGKGISPKCREICSKWMKENNPMKNPETAKRVAEKLKGTHHNRVTDYQRRVTSKRMKENNPMKNPETAKRVAEKMRGRKELRSRTIKRSKYTKILQYDLNGNLIREWELISDISKTLNIKTHRIYEVLYGRQKATGGYRWKFI